MARDRDIQVNVLCAGKRYELRTYPHEYRSLMALIYDKVYLEDFGDCKGIGRCGTCHVLLLNYHEGLLKREGNEHSTLNKLSTSQSNSRLSCQILLDSMVNGLAVEVVEDDHPGLY